MVKESSIEAYLLKCAKVAGSEVRKVAWIGRSGAPDRVIMGGLMFRKRCGHLVADRGSLTCWVELKNPETIKTFPANDHERAQAREHARMRAQGQWVEVIGTKEQVAELFGLPCYDCETEAGL